MIIIETSRSGTTVQRRQSSSSWKESSSGWRANTSNDSAMTNADKLRHFRCPRVSQNFRIRAKKFLVNRQYRQQLWETAKKPVCSSFIAACPDDSRLLCLADIKRLTLASVITITRVAYDS